MKAPPGNEKGRPFYKAAPLSDDNEIVLHPSQRVNFKPLAPTGHGYVDGGLDRWGNAITELVPTVEPEVYQETRKESQSLTAIMIVLAAVCEWVETDKRRLVVFKFWAGYDRRSRIEIIKSSGLSEATFDRLLSKLRSWVEARRIEIEEGLMKEAPPVIPATPPPHPHELYKENVGSAASVVKMGGRAE
jgi:hypothetical protein